MFVSVFKASNVNCYDPEHLEVYRRHNRPKCAVASLANAEPWHTAMLPVILYYGDYCKANIAGSLVKFQMLTAIYTITAAFVIASMAINYSSHLCIVVKPGFTAALTADTTRPYSYFTLLTAACYRAIYNAGDK